MLLLLRGCYFLMSSPKQPPVNWIYLLNKTHIFRYIMFAPASICHHIQRLNFYYSQWKFVWQAWTLNGIIYTTRIRSPPQFMTVFLLLVRFVRHFIIRKANKKQQEKMRTIASNHNYHKFTWQKVFPSTSSSSYTLYPALVSIWRFVRRATIWMV